MSDRDDEVRKMIEENPPPSVPDDLAVTSMTIRDEFAVQAIDRRAELLHRSPGKAGLAEKSFAVNKSPVTTVFAIAQAIRQAVYFALSFVQAVILFVDAKPEASQTLFD